MGSNLQHRRPGGPPSFRLALRPPADALSCPTMDTTPTTSRTRDVAYQLHPFTNLGRHENEGPLVINRGKGVYVYDESGREYLEALAGLWCTALGFGEPRLAEAAF